MNTIKPGIYEHYKGKLYQVYGVCRHSETEEEMVVYRTLYGDYSLWVRPYQMFCESICIDGITRPRFRWLRDADEKTGSNRQI